MKKVFYILVCITWRLNLINFLFLFVCLWISFFFSFDGDNIENRGSFSSTAQAFGYYGKPLFDMNLKNDLRIIAYRYIVVKIVILHGNCVLIL